MKIIGWCLYKNLKFRDYYYKARIEVYSRPKITKHQDHSKKNVPIFCYSLFLKNELNPVNKYTYLGVLESKHVI